MGVPKFYRWISERYPCLSETVKGFQIPEFDNLYFDMNGIIHTCSHPEDDNPHFRITEEKIFTDIFYYIEFLFRMIKPRKVFFMAVDGVAPRAKMNQQRGRRFRSAREAQELEERARKKGEVLPTEKRFDSNCITPGTEFMVKLQEQLKYFVVSKVSTDPLWHGVHIYLSGHESPGEGEHKIMDFIRHQKSQTGYDPNTRHCLYGLDADLMMLGLTSHEPHFSLLREEVRFGGKRDRNKRPATPEETTFHLLHLSLFREYLDFEFSSIKEKLTFEYDLERVIDDWVLLGFLVGNDFIPHLPHLHIHHDALPILWKTYMETIPDCGGYLNEGGHLNLERFEIYLDALTKFEVAKFSEELVDLRYFEGKKAEKSSREAQRNMKKVIKKSENSFAALEGDGDGVDGLAEIPNSLIEYSQEISVEEDEEFDTFDAEFILHKRNYYMTKLEYEKVTPEVLKEQAEGYVRAIQWILLYYYEGVPSWSWFYPQHYTPYISDIRNFSQMKMDFDYSSPFLPFQQLMAVLPSASKELLPQPFQDLMTMEASPIIDFYPVEFKSDLNGKQQDWEAVVLIPFIEESRLLSAMKSQSSKLSKDENNRNKHGPCFLYEYVPDALETYQSSLPESFPNIEVNHAKVAEISAKKFVLKSRDIVKGLLEDVRLDVYFPGFPTLKHIPHKSELKKAGVKVFQMNSRSENMIVHILDESEPDVESVAKDLLGNTVYVGWPHLYEAKVISVSDDMTRFKLVEQLNVKGHRSSKSIEEKEMKKEVLQQSESGVWHREVQSITEKYHGRLGVETGPTFILLHALPMTGRRYVCGSHSKITLEKQFSSYPVPFVLQATVKDIDTCTDDYCQYRSLSDMFPEKSSIFMLGWPHYGCQGEVLDADDLSDGRVRIFVTIPEELDVNSISHRQQYYSVKYMPAYVVAQRLGLDKRFVARITGCIMIRRGSPENSRDNFVNIGLNMKFSKKNEEVPGYTKLENDGWAYSQKSLQSVNDYMKEFPDIWDYISTHTPALGDMYFESEVFSQGKKLTLEKVLEYLKNLPSRNIKSQKCGADILDEGIIQLIEEEVNRTVELNKKKLKKVKMHVKPHLLFKPLTRQGGLIPDVSATYQLFDRVVNVRHGFAVPFGLRGTMVGIHPAEREMDILYDVVFDEEFQGGIIVRCSAGRGYRVPPSALINLTHGERKHNAQPNNQKNAQLEQSGQHMFNQQGFNNRSEGDQYGRSHQQPFNNRYDSEQYTGGQRTARLKFQENRGENEPNNFTGNNMDNRNRSQQVDNRYGGQQGSYAGNRMAGTGYGGSDGQWNRQGGYSGEKMSSWNAGQVDNRHGYQQGIESDSGYQQGSQSGRTHENQLADSKNKTEQKSFTNTNQATQSTQESFANRSFGGATQTSVQFVTPKVSSQASGQGKRTPKDTMSQDNEFANLWKSLQESSPQKSSKEINSDDRPKSVNKEKTSQETSLQMAASSLKNISTPSSGKVDSSSEQHNQSEADVMKKIELDNLFMQASKAQPPVMSTGSDDFAAIFKSLEISKDKSVVDKAKKTEENSLIADTPKQDTTEALKQMLKIGSDKVPADESNTHPPTESTEKSYGRQLSVQELFEGVQQQAQAPKAHSQEPTQSQPPPPPQVSSHTAQPPQAWQAQQAQQHHVKPPPSLKGLNPGVAGVPQRGYTSQAQRHQRPQHVTAGASRNPVLELLNWSKSMGFVPPRYDYLPKDGSFISVVTLPTGARFQGSPCKSQETAAESAASIALLQLKNVMKHMSVHPIITQMMYGQAQFSSSNSAFSPVTPRGTVMPPHQYPMYPPVFPAGNPRDYFPGQVHSHPQMQHRGARFQQQPYQQQHPQTNQYTAYRKAYEAPNKPAAGPPQQVAQFSLARTDATGKYTTSQYQQSFCRQWQQTGQVPSASEKTGIPLERTAGLTASANPFIPLQVTKQQKTPLKKKDSEHKDTEKPQLLKDMTAVSNVACIDMTVSHTNVPVNSNGSASCSTQGHISSKPTPKDQHTGGRSEQKQKKRRPRIAANFQGGHRE